MRDRDGNGINDEIRIKVPVVIADSGEYDVVVTLKDRHGQEERAAERDFLGEGSHFVSMTIPVSRLGVRAVEEVEVVTAILIRFGDNDAYGQDEEPSLGFVKPE